LGFGKLVHGGIAEYWRMFRVLIWSVIPLGIAFAICGGIGQWSSGVAEKAILESSADTASHVATALMIVLLLLADASVDAGRAQFIHSVNRRSAIKAWWTGIKLVLRHPVAAFGQYLILTLIGLVLAGVFGVLRIRLGHVHLPGFLLSIVLTQLLVASLGWMKAARLYALASVSK
jgi:hypothetical protein